MSKAPPSLPVTQTVPGVVDQQEAPAQVPKPLVVRIVPEVTSPRLLP
jgi:hypothetical protein